MKHPLRFLFLLLACCHFALMMGAPARRGHWIQVVTTGGKSVNVELLGDERIRYARRRHLVVLYRQFVVLSLRLQHSRETSVAS